MSEIKKRNKENTIDKSKTNNTGKKMPIFKRKISLRVLSLVVVISSLLIIVYFSSKDEKVKTFARQSEVLVGKELVVECSLDLNEIDKYEQCYPKECKRFVTDQVVTGQEAEELLAIARKGFQLGGRSDGGASTLDLHTGALTKGQDFVNIYKTEALKKVFTPDDYYTFKVVKEKIKYAVANNFGVSPAKLYLTSPTFFSEIAANKKPSAIFDEYWHPHVDKVNYKAFHYTTLLYLGHYGIDFKGGRFVFIDEKFNFTIEPRKGRISMFTSGKENVHYVEKVTSGVRYAVTVAFSCDKQFELDEIIK